MNVRFIAPGPRERARPELDVVLAHGRDQIAIACAFLTPGGVEALRRHAAHLKRPDSFVVIGWDQPTSLDALNELHSLMPGNLYVHLGSLTPVEKGLGSGLMHSKVFYAKDGNQCRLWTGSHNLTANAMQGVNCEAAIVVEGDSGEQVFQDALLHLERCRAESIVFDPLNPPPSRKPEQTLVLHAEMHSTVSAPPWFVHLRPNNTDYDGAMKPPAAVWLYLYPPGSLQPGKPRPAATSAYSGTLTALNFTERHPRHRGISADWQAADRVIELRNGVPCLVQSSPNTTTPSQGVFRVEAREDEKTIWLKESPQPKLEREVGEHSVSEVDPEFRRFYTPSSLTVTGLLHQGYRSIKGVIRAERKEIGLMEPDEMRERFIKPDEQIELIVEEKLDQRDKFAFIYRAKYQA
ncbi:MAG: hypothetical protein KDM63_20810 [Verrucomicrobiae bacterium]|nr:hypothetical protein [Verrucomicrobiae bacterium]